MNQKFLSVLFLDTFFFLLFFLFFVKDTNRVSFTSASMAVLQRPQSCLWTEVEQHAAAQAEVLFGGSQLKEDNGRFTTKVLPE